MATPLRSYLGLWDRPLHHYVIPTLHASASSVPWPRPTMGGAVREPGRGPWHRFATKLAPWPRLGRSHPRIWHLLLHHYVILPGSVHLLDPLDNVVGHASSYVTRNLVVFPYFRAEVLSLRGKCGACPWQTEKVLSRLASRPHLACSSVLRHRPGWMACSLCRRQGSGGARSDSCSSSRQLSGALLHS